jgi:hypothetical protein
MSASAAVFQALALCTQRPGGGLVDAALSAAVARLTLGALAEAAESHLLEPLLFAHVRAARVAADASSLDQLRARYVQHAHACAVRTRVMGEALDAMHRSRVRLLVLKGAALAGEVYADPRLRPMRDVDLLVHPDDLRRAHDVLCRGGFTTGGVMPLPWHHHLPGLSRTVDGATIIIELHHQMLPATPFIAPLTYRDLASASRPIGIGGVEARAPGWEDMLWHVYAHGFAVNTLRPGLLRLISLADVVHATEAWADLIDWDRVRARYPRLVPALSLVSCVVPWSHTVEAHLGDCVPLSKWPVDPVPSSSALTSALRADVLWPAEWWFRMRYGISGLPAWVWYRLAGHPAACVVSAARSVANQLSRRLRPNARHRMLVNS